VSEVMRSYLRLEWNKKKAIFEIAHRDTTDSRRNNSLNRFAEIFRPVSCRANKTTIRNKQLCFLIVIHRIAKTSPRHHGFRIVVISGSSILRLLNFKAMY
jgi:hypothetical protein